MLEFKNLARIKNKDSLSESSNRNKSKLDSSPKKAKLDKSNYAFINNNK